MIKLTLPRSNLIAATALSAVLTALACIATASAQSMRMLMPEYASPLWRSGRMMRPDVLPAFHGFIHVLTPCSRSATILSVTRV